jgi:hypothetical protein
MSVKKIGLYSRTIQRITNCSSKDAPKINQIMRDDVLLHTLALDWISPVDSHKDSVEAEKTLDVSRADHKEYFSATRVIFDEVQAARATSS